MRGVLMTSAGWGRAVTGVAVLAVILWCAVCACLILGALYPVIR